MASFSIFFDGPTMLMRVIDTALLGGVIAGLAAADVKPAMAQVIFEPKASQTTYFALDQGCVGKIPPDFEYFCTRMDYNTGPYSSNFHFTGQAGTVVTYIVEQTPVRPSGPSRLQAIILREQIDGKSAMLNDFTGSCEVRERQDMNYFLIKCWAQKGTMVIEHMGRFYK
jgi:hypothetical protein